MYREQVLDNFYMVKEAGFPLITAGIGAVSGRGGKRAGKEIARDKYRNLTTEDLVNIEEESQGAGRGALRGLGYGIGGGVLGAGLSGGHMGAAGLGALGLGVYGALKSRKKAKKEYLRKAQALSDRKLLSGMRRDRDRDRRDRDYRY